MNELKEKFIKKAIVDFGFELEPNIFWFTDERKIYYSKVEEGTVTSYIYGSIANNSFLVEYTSSQDEIDIIEWKTFIERYLDTVCIIDII